MSPFHFLVDNGKYVSECFYSPFDYCSWYGVIPSRFVSFCDLIAARTPFCMFARRCFGGLLLLSPMEVYSIDEFLDFQFRRWGILHVADTDALYC